MATSTLLPAVQGPPPDDPLPGTLVGQYKIERAVAAGGMGIVYVAKHALLGRSVAVKVLRPEYARNAEQTERFLKEAQAISGIRHKGIVSVEDFGALADGRQFMVMEYLEGENLEQVLQRDAPLHPNRALPIIDEVLDALSAAHKVGVVHRDLKPSNIFLTTQSNGTRYCKLVDFGLAQRSLFSAEDAPAFAKASLVAGTPEYVSPEQARGLVATARTDIYCCGVILFEMLTGRLPFAAPTLMELLRKHVYEKAPRVSHTHPVSESLDDLVASMLEKEPEARPRSADVVRQAISRILKELKEASTQYVSRPGPLMRPPGAMAEPVLEETHVSGANSAYETPEPKDAVTDRALRPGSRDQPKDPRSDGRGKKVPPELLNGAPGPKDPRSDGRGKKVPADILGPVPLPKEPKSDGRGKKAPEGAWDSKSEPKKPAEILSLPPEPRSDGRGRKGINIDETIDSQVTKPPEAITPKVDAQMERTLEPGTGGSDPLLTQSGSQRSTKPGEDTLSAGQGSRDLTVPHQSPKQKLAIVGFLLLAAVAVAAALAFRSQVAEQPAPPPPKKAEKVEKVEKVEPPVDGPGDDPDLKHAAAVVQEPDTAKSPPPPVVEKTEPVKQATAATQVATAKVTEPDANPKKKGPTGKAYEAAGQPVRDNHANEIPKACYGDWKQGVKREIRAALQERFKTAEVSAKEGLDKEAEALRRKVDKARTPEDCARVISDISKWALGS